MTSREANKAAFLKATVSCIAIMHALSNFSWPIDIQSPQMYRLSWKLPSQ